MNYIPKMNLKKIFSKKADDANNILSINNLKFSKNISDVYILGNGPSLNNHTPNQLKGEYIIGTNRSWLWGNTDMLIWRDSRITQEIEFFQVQKPTSSLWICSKQKSFIIEKIQNYEYSIKNIDYTFNDHWLKKMLYKKIKWNGIIFYAIAISKMISPEATIHLLGVDLIANNDNHHFFSSLKGFQRGYYAKAWHNESFNYQKRLNIMYENFKILHDKGFRIKNYSPNSKLIELFGYSKL